MIEHVHVHAIESFVLDRGRPNRPVDVLVLVFVEPWRSSVEVERGAGPTAQVVGGNVVRRERSGRCAVVVFLCRSHEGQLLLAGQGELGTHLHIQQLLKSPAERLPDRRAGLAMVAAEAGNRATGLSKRRRF